MSRYPLWAVLAPGEPSWMKKRAYAALELEEDEEDEDGPPFEVVPGSGRYHAIVGLDDWRVGVELQIAEALSLECDEPVYAIERANDPWLVMVFHNGRGEVEEVGPESLAKSLGCPLPGSEESSDSPERKPLRTAALIEGLRAEEAHRALEENLGEPLPPGRYHLVDTPRGLLLAGGTGGMNFAHIDLSERFPHAIVYEVTASPGLDFFAVTVMRGCEGIGEFAQPPDEMTYLPLMSEIKGERSPERILAALGIPAEWFLNE
jgi:hypothetical protein